MCELMRQELLLLFEHYVLFVSDTIKRAQQLLLLCIKVRVQTFQARGVLSLQEVIVLVV